MVWLRSTLYSVAFAATMFVLLPGWILAETGPTLVEGGWMRAAGFALLGIGVAVMLLCIGTFGTHGRGTPAPFDPPRKLVIRGPYRYVRNPLYLAGMLVLIGEAVLFSSVPLLEYTAAFWLATHLLVVGYEERALSHSFGSDYAAYRATVNRWLPHRHA